MVGNLRSPVWIDGLIGFPGRNHLNASGGEQRTQSDAEGEVGILLQLSAGEVSTRIVSAVSGIENHDESGCRWKGGRGRGGRRARNRTWRAWRRLLAPG